MGYRVLCEFMKLWEYAKDAKNAKYNILDLYLLCIYEQPIMYSYIIQRIS